MLSSSAPLLVPQTMLSSSVDVPQTVFEQSSPPHVVPQTMLSSVLGPQTTSSHALFAHLVPQTMLSSSDEDPLIVVVQSSLLEQTLPHTIVSPSPVLAAPHVTS